jgi:hypothetical protein
MVMGRGVKALGVKPVRAIGRLLCVVALGTMLAGCDRCGDWWWLPNQSQSCKGKLPPQQ